MLSLFEPRRVSKEVSALVKIDKTQGCIRETYERRNDEYRVSVTENEIHILENCAKNFELSCTNNESNREFNQASNRVPATSVVPLLLSPESTLLNTCFDECMFLRLQYS